MQSITAAAVLVDSFTLYRRGGHDDRHCPSWTTWRQTKQSWLVGPLQPPRHSWWQHKRWPRLCLKQEPSPQSSGQTAHITTLHTVALCLSVVISLYFMTKATINSSKINLRRTETRSSYNLLAACQTRVMHAVSFFNLWPKDYQIFGEYKGPLVV